MSKELYGGRESKELKIEVMGVIRHLEGLVRFQKLEHRKRKIRILLKHTELTLWSLV